MSVVLLVGLLSAVVSGIAGVMAVLKGAEKRRRWHPPTWLQIGLIAVLTTLSMAMLYVQDRSGTAATARLMQLRDDLQNTFAMLYKQETIRTMELRVQPEGCLTNSRGEVEMWANSLPDLVRVFAGRSPAANETALLRLSVKYGPLWIYLWGQANKLGEAWIYSVGTESLPPGMVVAGAPVPNVPNQGGRWGLIDLRLNEGHIRAFIPTPPSIDRVVMPTVAYLGGKFDPREVMGYFTVSAFGIHKGVFDVRQPPPTGVGAGPEWQPIEIPMEVLRCWDVGLTINGRSIFNIMKTGPYGGSTGVRARLLKFPGPFIEEKFQTGLVWLAPNPESWRELRPLMDCNLRWLLYAESKLPCLVTGKEF